MRRKLNEMYSQYNLKIRGLFKGGGMMCLVFMISISSVFSQELKTISGKITDEVNQPLPYVNVIIDGTTIGVVSDANGTYSIKAPSTATSLIFSSIGYITETIKIGENTVVNIQLLPDLEKLDEVVIIGYGTQKKATLTGSVTQIKGEDAIQGKGTSNTALALQGEVSGLVVTRTSSRPGNEDIDIKIRGDISVNGIGPLILLDGLEIPQWELAQINSNDVESISVLKDAAAAIYGTKAAGGVILVTTKKGVRGKIKVNYSGVYQLNYISKELPLANYSEWADMMLQLAENDAIGLFGDTTYRKPSYPLGFTTEMMENLRDGILPDPDSTIYFGGKNHRIADVDQFSEIYGTTPSKRHNISISGGTEDLKFYTSIGYSDERSIIDYVYDGVKKYNMRTNLEYEVNELLKTEFNIAYDSRLISEPTNGVGQGLRDFYIFPLFNPQGDYYDIFGAANVLAQLDKGGRTNNTENVLRAGAKVTLNLDKYIQGLNIVFDSKFRSRQGKKVIRNTAYELYDWEGNVTFTPTTLTTSDIKQREITKFFQNHNLLANYGKNIGKHQIGITAGMVAEHLQTDTLQIYRSNMLSNDLDDIGAGDPTTQEVTAGSNAIGLLSYIGRLNYDYQGIYLLEVLGRRDGSSQLHEDFRWKNFGGASAGIRLSELDVVKSLRVFDNLKIRSSYGETGSVTGIGNYDYISSIKMGTVNIGTNGTVINTAKINGITSVERTWERVSTLNFGVDFSVLDSRLNGTLEYYIRKNNNMLIGITYPQLLGGSAPKTNSGDFTTKGWELSTSWRDKIGGVTYSIGGWLGDSRSEVVRMDGKQQIEYGTNKIVEGKPLNAIYVYRTDGYLQNDEEVYAYYEAYGFDTEAETPETPKAGSSLPKFASTNRLIPGCVKRVDTNGDGLINTDDLDYYGDANPHFSFGINIGLSYKNFDFSAFFQGVGQQYLVRTGTLSAPFKSWWTQQNNTFIGQTWTEDNRNAPYPIISSGDRLIWNYNETNDIGVQNVAYVRAKNISLGYTVPKSLLEKVKIEKVRIYVASDDPFVISNVADGLDPEKKDNAHYSSETTVPYTSTLLFGIDITF